MVNEMNWGITTLENEVREEREYDDGVNNLTIKKSIDNVLEQRTTDYFKPV